MEKIPPPAWLIRYLSPEDAAISGRKSDLEESFLEVLENMCEDFALDCTTASAFNIQSPGTLPPPMSRTIGIQGGKVITKAQERKVQHYLKGLSEAQTLQSGLSALLSTTLMESGYKVNEKWAFDLLAGALHDHINVTFDDFSKRMGLAAKPPGHIRQLPETMALEAMYKKSKKPNAAELEFAASSHQVSEDVIKQWYNWRNRINVKFFVISQLNKENIGSAWWGEGTP